MAYQVLYRKYRPKTFADLVGQEAITTTLINAIKNNQTSHAYLFSGPRGTGKTSAAKIFAREVNHIDENTSTDEIPDIIEIDAASNNGVDEIRSIRDNANYAPVQAEYKIYIVDEVHMLSIGAFNALLKTIEEPPAQIKFILATTEVQKIPATILSRVQRFDFRRIPVEIIEKRIQEILVTEKIDYDKKAVHLIAVSANGGLRDALSLLDQSLARDEEKLSFETVLDVTGSVSQEAIISFFVSIATNNLTEALQLIDSMLLSGKNANKLLEDLLSLVKDFLLYQNKPELIEYPITKQFKQAASFVNATNSYQIVETIDQTIRQLKLANREDVYLQVLAVQLSNILSSNTSKTIQSEGQASEVTNSQQIVQSQEVESLQQNNIETNNNGQEEKNETDNSDNMNESVIEEETKISPTQEQAVESTDSIIQTSQSAVEEVLKQAKKDELFTVQEAWPEIIEEMSIAHQAILSESTPVAASEQGIVATVSYDSIIDAAKQNKDLGSSFQTLLAETLGNVYSFVFINEENWQKYRSEYIQKMRNGKRNDPVEEPPKDQNTLKSLPNDPIAAAKQIFGEENVEIED